MITVADGAADPELAGVGQLAAEVGRSAAVSAATGFGVSEPASQILFRWMVGIQN